MNDAAQHLRSRIVPLIAVGLLVATAFAAHRAVQAAPDGPDDPVHSRAPVPGLQGLLTHGDAHDRHDHPLSFGAFADSSKKLLVLRVYFNNYSATARYTQAEVVALMDDMNDLWRQTSYDVTEMDFAVTALYQVPGDDDDYVDWSTNFSSAAQMAQLLVDAVGAAPAGTDFDDLDGLLVLMAETDAANWHRGRAGTYTVPIGEEGADVSLKSAIFVENPSDADVKVWGRWMHEIGHVFQVAGPAHPSKYDSNFELMDASYPGQTGVFEKLPTLGFPGWLPEWKYIAFTPHPSIGTDNAGVGGGLASLWAVEYDPDDSPSAQAVQAFVTDTAYYLVSFRRRILGDDLNSSFSPAGIPDEGVLIERVVEGGDPGSEDRWVTLQPPPGGDVDDLWQCGQKFTNQGDGIEILVGREVVRELVVTAEADAWIREGDAVNHGSEEDLYVGNFTNPEGGFDGRFRSLVRFSLADLPAGAVVQSAALELQHVAFNNTQVVPIVALNLLAPWSQNAVTWANQPASAAVSTAITDVGAGGGTVSWNVTTQVQNWQAGTANNGLLLKAVNEQVNAVQRRFRSREYLALGIGGAGNSFAPRLRIVYTLVCPPEDNDPDRSYVRVTYDPGASRPDVHFSPWRVPPLNDWESTDIWIDSPVNGYGTYRYGTWESPWGDQVPYWNGDEPLVDSPNRIVTRVRNLGTKNATNVRVHFDITDPPGLGIADADGFKNLGTVDQGDFPGLALIPPGGYTDVYVTYTPDVALSEQEIEDGFFVFHTCLSLRADAVTDETILGNQDGNEEQENMFWYEVPATDDADAPPPAPFSQTIHLKNFDPDNAREFTLYYEPDLPDGWTAEVNGGQQTVTLGPAAAMDVPVTLSPPDPLPPVGSTASLDVAAAYLELLENSTLSGPHQHHPETRALGGVTVVGGVVAATDTHCVAARNGGQIEVSGVLSAALGEHLTGSVLIRPSPGGPPGLTALAPVSRVDGTFTAVLEDSPGAIERIDCLFGGTRRLGRSADASVPVPPGSGRPTPTAEPPVVVAIVRGRGQIGPTDVYTISVDIVGSVPAAGLFDTVEIALTFDPEVVRVVDADPRTPGVQVLPRGALEGFDIRRNEADNRAGTIVLTAARRTQAEPRERSLLAVGFEAVAAGSSRLVIERLLLSGTRGSLPVELRHGIVDVVSDPARLPFRITGTARLEGRSRHAGILVCAPAGCSRTDERGDYTVPGVRVGQHITATHPSYLSTWVPVPGAPGRAGGPLEMQVFQLLAGDVDGDGVIGLADGVAVLGGVGSSRAQGRYIVERDINGNGIIDGEDVALVSGNWGMSAESPDGRAGPRRRSATDGGNRNGGVAGASLSARPDQRAGLVLRVEPAAGSVVAGEPITVEVRATGAANVAGFELELLVDPLIARPRDADPLEKGIQGEVGDLFPPADTLVLHNAVDVRRGLFALAAGLAGQLPGVSGDGVVARYVLDTLRPGGTDIRIHSVEVRNDAWPNAAVIVPEEVVHGSLDVLPVPSPTPTDGPTPTPSATSVGGTPASPTATTSTEPPTTGTPATPTPTGTPATATPTGSVSPSPSADVVEARVYLPRTLTSRDGGAWVDGPGRGGEKWASLPRLGYRGPLAAH